MKKYGFSLAAIVAAFFLFQLISQKGDSLAFGYSQGVGCSSDPHCAQGTCPNVVNAPDVPPTPSTMAACAAGNYWSVQSAAFNCNGTGSKNCNTSNYGVCAYGFPCQMQWQSCDCGDDGYWECMPVWSESTSILPARYGDQACTTNNN